MIILWIAAALLAAASAALTAWRAAAASGGTAGDGAAQVYRRQLSEIDDLAARGLIGEDERRVVQAETGRRLLAAAEAPGAVAAKRLSDRAILLLAALPALAALGLYFVVGSPQFGDLPFKPRLVEWRAHPERYGPPELAAVLEAIAADRPHDAEPLMRLAVLDIQAGDPDGAIRALRRANVADPSRAEAWAMLGEVTVLKADGAVDPAAEAIFRRTLALDPASATARYYLARARVLKGDAAGGLADWRALEASLPADDPRRPALAEDIAAVQATGKPAVARAPATPQPQITDAIRQMVDGLAARLKSRPDDPQGWTRLVRAYAVMGETAKRDAALAEARARYRDRPDVLSQLNAAAVAPGQ